jgi:ribosomal protein S14
LYVSHCYRYSIADQITDHFSSHRQQAQPADAEASLRDALSGQIASAQANLETSLEEMRRAASASGDGLALSHAQAQLMGLAHLQKRLTHAQGASLLSIRAEIAASVAVTQSFLQQARAVITLAQTAELALQAASDAAHHQVTSFVADFYDKEIFEPYLRFASPEDERAYRQREEERHRAIEQAQREGTPEANLRALDLSRAQLNDAGAHGADRSPDYQRQMHSLDAARENLAGAISRQSEGASRPISATADPLDDVAPAPGITAQALATLRAAGVAPSSEPGAHHTVDLPSFPSDLAGPGGRNV